MGADLFQQLLSLQTQREPATSRHIFFVVFASCPELQEMTWQSDAAMSWKQEEVYLLKSQFPVFALFCTPFHPFPSLSIVFHFLVCCLVFPEDPSS